MMRKLLFMVATALLAAGCSSNDNEEPKQPAKRTVMVYMAAENSLSSYAQQDINEMIDGVKSISKWDNLIVFVDRASTREKPFIIRLRDDKNAPADTIRKYEQDFVSSDPERMKEVLSWMMSNYPADDYGLVMWGHANGWVIMNDSVAVRRAIVQDDGVDTSNKQYFMNIPTLRTTLQSLPHPLKFIFADCCNVQNIEVAYELKDVTQYLIASPAPIPDKGAPYKTVIPDLFNHSDVQMYSQTCDDYYDLLESEDGHLPISVIKTSQLPLLAQVTKEVIRNIYQSERNINTDQLIYYYTTSSSGIKERIMYDMQDFVLRHAEPSDFQKWLNIYNQVVVYKKLSKHWQWHAYNSYTLYADFGDITEERFGGVSMFIPLERYENTKLKYNTLIKQTAWYQAVGWSELGW